MAGMFYTLQEVLAKLGKTEADIKALVKEGKLREFRDGTKQLYKTEDVDALAAVPKGDSVLSDSLQLSIDETADVSLAPEEIDTLMGNDKQKDESKFKLDETGELVADEALDKPTKDETTLLPADTKKGGDIDLSELEKADTTAGGQPPKKSGATAGGTNILSDTKTGDSKISLSGESINVLGGSETEFKISDDTSGETKVVSKGPKALDDKGKEEPGGARLDDDVNLEGIGGSGSGLLDLSLQADDTSLGAVLDDIYPESPAATPVAEQPSPAPSGSVAEEAEKIFEGSGGRPAMEQTVAAESAAAAYAEPAPDASSGLYGIMLFLPLAALLYTAIIVLSGYKPIANLKVLSSIEPLIWYVIGGVAGLVLFIAIIGMFMGGGPRPPKAPKPPKEKKVKKDKKAKKEKEAPAKEG